jgi:hypothetical protein
MTAANKIADVLTAAGVSTAAYATSGLGAALLAALVAAFAVPRS